VPEDSLPPIVQLEQLAKLADDRWREYRHQSQAEWRLSFGIWTVLLAATLTLLNLPDSADSLTPVLLIRISFAFAGLSVAGHWLFLWRMHTKLAILRNEMNTILNRRRDLLDFRNDEKTGQDTPGRSSMYMQFFISLLAAALFLATAVMLSVAVPDNSDAVYGCANNSGRPCARAEIAVLSYSPHG
jgi:hypothetical protein